MVKEFGHVGVIGIGLCVDTWGTGPFVIIVGAKQYRFDDSDRFGPLFIRKDGNVAENALGERSPFWKAHRIWRQQGRRLEEDGITCIFDKPPKPKPTIWRWIGNRRFIVEPGDEDGGYIEEAKPPMKKD